MKVAITGATGFLGSYLTEYIKKNESDEMVLLSRRDVQGMCTTDYSIEDLKKKLCNVDTVVHLAATRSSKGMIAEFHTNEILLQNLYEACRQLNITNIIYTSTISVYSDEKLIPWSEDVIPKPSLMYGISKLTGEYIGNYYNQKYNMKIKNLRLAHLFGFNEKNNYMINKFMRQAYNKNTLVLRDGSLAKREFLYAKDAALAIYKAMCRPDVKGTFNIGSGIALTNKEVAIKINKVFSQPNNMIIENELHNDLKIKSSLMDSSLAFEHFMYTPEFSFEDALKEIFSQMEELVDVPEIY